MVILIPFYKRELPAFSLKNLDFTIDSAVGISGKKKGLVCGIIVQINFVKVGIVYTITASLSMRYVKVKELLPSPLPLLLRVELFPFCYLTRFILPLAICLLLDKCYYILVYAAEYPCYATKWNKYS